MVLLAAIVLAGACGTGAQGGGDQTLVLATPGSPALLDGAQTRDPEAGRAIAELFEPLLKFHRDGIGLRPGLASAWENSTDGLRWTFHLRRDVRFQDGTPFNAGAVCRNFERWYHFRGIQQSLGVALSWREVFGGFATQDDPSAPAESLYRSCDAPPTTRWLSN